TGEAPTIPKAPLLEPDSLPTSLTQPILKTLLPEPEAKIPMLEQKIHTTPILKPEPLENPQIRASEPMLVPEAELKPFVPMLELNELTEPEVPSEIEFDRKLLHSKKIRQAEQEFNQHIQTMVQPKLAMFDPGLYVRIELEIGVSGKIIRYKILEASPSNAFNQAAQLAVRNVNLNPLPEALAENPPYIVVVKVIPQLQ
ncbi:MAG: energy transducer TonB, partial [SAR324 cluster bacterium]|nr:energy transducer TonB [SAR324 cluster bacterium]